MSHTVLTKENLSPVEPRRAPLRDADSEMNSQRPSNRRSLSGKLRSLFRKSSPSPKRAATERVQSSSTRPRSPSPELAPASTEAPHLRAPMVNWTFGRKKSKLTGPASERVKKKETRKSAKTLIPAAQISAPIHSELYQTSIRGENFVPRTPEQTHGTAGRTRTSSITPDATTKGFRDYMVIDSTKSNQRDSAPDSNVAVLSPFSYDRSRSPSLNHQHLVDIVADHQRSRRRQSSSTPPSPELEISPRPQRMYMPDDRSPYRASQVLVENNPLLSSTASQPTASYPWRTTSNTSLNNTEIRSTTSSSMDVDVPKLHAPVVPLQSSTRPKELQPTPSLSYPEQAYSSLSTASSVILPNHSHTTTYGSLPDTSISHKENLSTYPGLAAIVAYHFRPTAVHFNTYPSSVTTTPKRTPRFDTCTTTTTTTTSNDYDEKPHWSPRDSTSSPISNYQHDGFIRPMTPPQPTFLPDDREAQTARSNSSDPPRMYRSSTIIYVKEKVRSPNGGIGELRTWSSPDNEDTERYQKPSTSVHTLPARYPNGSSNTSRDDHVYEYESLRSPYYSENPWNSTRSRSERDFIYDPSTPSYKFTEYAQGNDIINF